MLKKSPILKTAFVLVCAVLAPACGSDNGGGGSGNAATEATTANSQALAVANQGIVLALSAPTQLKFAAIQPQTVTCQPSGDAAVTGDVTSEPGSTSFGLAIDYNNCGGVNLEGTLDAQGSAELGAGTLTYNYTFDGTLISTDCDLTYQALAVTITSSGVATIDGTLDAECTSGAVTCEYVNVDVTDQDALTSACL